MAQTIQLLAILGGAVTAAGLLIGAGIWLGESRATARLSREYFERKFKELGTRLTALEHRITELEARGP